MLSAILLRALRVLCGEEISGGGFVSVLLPLFWEQKLELLPEEQPMLRSLVGIFLLWGALFMTTPIQGETPMFPEVDQLPSRPELPDPLTMFDGTPVKTPQDWYQKRRPELKALFEYYMYGQAPAAPEKIASKVLYENREFLSGKGTLREVELRFGPEGTPPLHVLCILPNDRKRPIPAFLSLNFCGNHTVVHDPGVALPQVWMRDSCPGCAENRATDAGRGHQAEMWSADYLIERGYALVTCYYGDIDPDKPDFTDGIHPHYFRAGQTEPGPHDWGAIRAWAWGVSRIIDYLVTVPDFDSQRLCVTGHSRLGKTALVAAAFDERVALVAPHQSGTGGCALSRDNDQETVERINRVFPHWFNDTFPKFDDREDLLPIDQNLLMALVAPRPFLDTEGDQDKWANYTSSHRALESAGKVYQFLGAKGLIGDGLVHGDEPIIGPKFSELMQYRRDTKHQMNRDYWQRMLDFAEAHLGEKPEGR